MVDAPDAFYTEARAAIDTLLNHGEAAVIAAAEFEDVQTGLGMHTYAAIAKVAAGYHNAINAIMFAMPKLHNELISTPRLVALRRFCRNVQL